jgi:hypothetical protein
MEEDDDDDDLIKARFSKKIIEHKMCAIYCTFLSETCVTLRGVERAVIKYVCWSSCKVPVILVRF